MADDKKPQEDWQAKVAKGLSWIAGNLQTLWYKDRAGFLLFGGLALVIVGAILALFFMTVVKWFNEIAADKTGQAQFWAWAVYLAPGLGATFTQRTHALAILALNVLLGWTFIGWVAALVWALADSKDKK